MKLELPKNKLHNFLKPEKQREFVQLDYAYITTKYHKIQESNDRLQKLITKFTVDPERRLNSVHESVICQSNLIKEKRDKSAAVKKNSVQKKKHFETTKLAIIDESVGHKKKKMDPIVDKISKKEIDQTNKTQITSIKTYKPKNYLYINKKDAFDLHGLTGKNVQIGKSVEKLTTAKEQIPRKQI